jgi:hypothetical protein
MPTPRVVFAKVAQILGDVDCDDEAAVSTFYEKTFTAYPDMIQNFVSEFIIAAEVPPPDEAYLRLRELVRVVQVLFDPLEPLPTDHSN